MACVAPFTAESLALSRWLRNIGIAIAARMPMMMITMSSSISVNPSVCRLRLMRHPPSGPTPTKYSEPAAASCNHRLEVRSRERQPGRLSRAP